MRGALSENVARSLVGGLPLNNTLPWQQKPKMRDIGIQTRAVFDFGSRTRTPKNRKSDALSDAGASAALASADGDRAAAGSRTIVLTG